MQIIIAIQSFHSTEEKVMYPKIIHPVFCTIQYNSVSIEENNQDNEVLKIRIGFNKDKSKAIKDSKVHNAKSAR